MFKCSLENDRLQVGLKTGGFGGLVALAAIANVALLIIGFCAALGVFPSGSTIGWVTLGLGGGASLIELASWGFKRDKPAAALITCKAVTLITLGILGGVSVLGVSQVGWGIIGTYGAFFLLSGGYICYYNLQPRIKKLF